MLNSNSKDGTEVPQSENVEVSTLSQTIAKPHVTGSLPFVRFASGNKIRFFMDFNTWEGVPDDVQFYPIDELHNGLIGFIGDGYGVLPKYNAAGKYGSGSIHIPKDQIPELVEWCRANFQYARYCRW